MTRDITKMIVHCSDSIDGDAKTFRQWHKARGWNDIGYHFVIRRDGEIEMGRMPSVQGAHTKGHNPDSIGVCLVGKQDFNEVQFISLRRLYSELGIWFSGLTAHAHNEFSTFKTCPNFDVKEVLNVR